MKLNVFNGHINISLLMSTLLIVNMFKLPGFFRCGPTADYVSSLHLAELVTALGLAHPLPRLCLVSFPLLQYSVACSNIITLVIIVCIHILL